MHYEMNKSMLEMVLEDQKYPFMGEKGKWKQLFKPKAVIDYSASCMKTEWTNDFNIGFFSNKPYKDK